MNKYHAEDDEEAVEEGCVGLSGCTGKSGGKARPAGESLPPFAKPTLDGKRMDLEDLRGQVVLVNVWATWCEPCKKEMPELARLHREHRGEGFTVVGVSVDVARARKHVERLVDDFQLPYPILLDPESEALKVFEVDGYPTSILIGRDGTKRWRRDGIIEDGDAELAEAIATALAEPAS